MPVYVMNLGALACSLLFGLRPPTFNAGSRSTICYCIVSEVGQPGPSADEYVARLPLLRKLVVLQLLFTKKLKKIPQQCHKEPMHIDYTTLAHA
jgi:hypothetical protein